MSMLSGVKLKLVFLLALAGLAAPAQETSLKGKQADLVVVEKSEDSLLNDLKALLGSVGGDHAYNLFHKMLVSTFDAGIDRKRPMSAKVFNMFGAGGARTIYNLPINSGTVYFDKEIAEEVSSPEGTDVVKLPGMQAFLQSLAGMEILNKTANGNPSILELYEAAEGFLRQDEKSSNALISGTLDNVRDTEGLSDEDARKLLGQNQLVARFSPDPASLGERRASFDEWKAKSLADMKILEDETPANYELRKAMTAGGIEVVKELVLESSSMEAALRFDPVGTTAALKTALNASAGTGLALNVQKMGQMPNVFERVSNENSVNYVSIRLPLTPAQGRYLTTTRAYLDGSLTDVLTKGFIVYNATEKNEETQEEKKVRTEVKLKASDVAKEYFKLELKLYSKYLEESAKQGSYESVLRTRIGADAALTTVSGMRVGSAASLRPVLESFRTGLLASSVHLDEVKGDGIVIHSVDVPEDAMKWAQEIHANNPKLYVAEVTLAPGVETVWFSVGQDALPSLQAAIQEARSGKAVAVPPIYGQVSLLPVVNISKRIADQYGVPKGRTDKQAIAILAKALNDYGYQGTDRIRFSGVVTGDSLNTDVEIPASTLKALAKVIDYYIADALGQTSVEQ